MASRALDLLQAERTQESTGRTFPDFERVSAWAKEGVQTSVQFGILQGNPRGELHPGASTTRAEAAAMVRRLLNLAAG
ncbi:S-layer homology domain-containing protein [Cohnella fermenti]|nr:S-layer homology domain-containing protein [Cohnella fermenti]